MGYLFDSLAYGSTPRSRFLNEAPVIAFGRIPCPRECAGRGVWHNSSRWPVRGSCIGARQMHISVPFPVFVVTVAVAIAAAVTDLQSRRIPNFLFVLGCVFGVALNVWTEGWLGLRVSAGGFAIGSAVMLPGYLVRFVGGGDLKLVAAVGSLLGPRTVLCAFLIAAIIAGLWAAAQGVCAWSTGGAGLPFSRYGAMLRVLLTTGRLTYYRPAEGEVAAIRVPFAPAMAMGSVLAPLLFS